MTIYVDNEFGGYWFTLSGNRLLWRQFIILTNVNLSSVKLCGNFLGSVFDISHHDVLSVFTHLKLPPYPLMDNQLNTGCAWISRDLNIISRYFIKGPHVVHSALWWECYGLLCQNSNNIHIYDFFMCVQYIPRNMHTVFALLCFVVVIHWLIFRYPSGLLH